MSKNKRPPLVNLKVLHRLEDEFDDPGPAHSFVRDFISFWDERYLRVVQAVTARDEAASREALFSVRIAAAMIGASRLARHVEQLEVNLKRGNFEALEAALPQLKECGAATIKKLTKEYVDVGW